MSDTISTIFTFSTADILGSFKLFQSAVTEYIVHDRVLKSHVQSIGRVASFWWSVNLFCTSPSGIRRKYSTEGMTLADNLWTQSSTYLPIVCEDHYTVEVIVSLFILRDYCN